MAIELKIICKDCKGTGKRPYGPVDEEPAICGDCAGSGYKTWGVLDDVDEKLDAIIAEQASQREDLTTALTQIWNKVKDL